MCPYKSHSTEEAPDVAVAPLLYLSEEEAAASLPGPVEAMALAARGLRAIAAGGTSLGHHVLRPRPGTGLSAILGCVRSSPVELAGIKWVSETASGVGAIMLLNDPASGRLHTALGARALTGLRTAAVSGACIDALAPEGTVALIGTGLQCRSHLAVLEALGRHEVRIAYRRRSSAEAVRAWAGHHTPSMRIEYFPDARSAVRDAGTVVTMVTRGTQGAGIDPEWLRDDALLLPVDFAHCLDAAVARTARLRATDHPPTFATALAHGELPDYPSIDTATGEALDWQPHGRRMLIQNLGNSACDLLIADATRRRALDAGLGRLLPL